MTVFRITLSKWANELKGSGRAARWNSNGYFIVYTAGTRALACLENLVHRKNIGKNDAFKIMLIDIPSSVSMDKINKESLKNDWRDYVNYSSCQAIGNEWIKKGSSAVLQIPSAIIEDEYNYLLNPQHPDFIKIAILKTVDFIFDSRLK